MGAPQSWRAKGPAAPSTAAVVLGRKTTRATHLTKERVKEIMDYVDCMDLPDAAYWQMVHELLDLEYGEVFQMIGRDPAFFGVVLEQ